MTELWYQILNVGVVLVSVVAVAFTLAGRKPVKKGAIFLTVGILAYVIAILFSDCDLGAAEGVIGVVKEIDRCVEAYRYRHLVAQVFILTGVFVLAISIFGKSLMAKFGTDTKRD